MKVFVYWNLHKKCWSIKELEGINKGIVVGHANALILKDITFKVSNAGRLRVLKENKKNVHAGVVGTIVQIDNIQAELGLNSAYYNPYKVSTFVDGSKVLKTASKAILLNKAVYYEN